MLSVAEPCLGPEEKEALTGVIDSGWITVGEKVRQFEQAFATLHDSDDSVAVGSCTAALHLFMIGLGIEPGDEVPVPAMTFVATSNSVLYVRARPVFVDIESSDVPLMSLEDAAAKAEGGAVIAWQPGLGDRIRQARGHGLTSGAFQRRGKAVPGYDMTLLGYNYRIDELRAALGLVQIKSLLPRNDHRRPSDLALSDAADVIVPFSAPRTTACHIMPIVLPRDSDRADVIGALRAAGVQTTIHYPPTHLFSYYRETFPNVHLPETEDFAERELTLPPHPKMQELHVDQVTHALSDALSRRRR
jgi:dTDP-4-amino-4,6-dideoxygalactose transaminase